MAQRGLGWVGLWLFVVTLTTWLVVLPRDWSSVAKGSSIDFGSPVRTWQWLTVGAVLLVAAVLGGAYGRWWLPLLAIAAPAILLYAVQAARAVVIGVNLWVVGTALFAAAATGGAALAGWLGTLLRRG